MNDAAALLGEGLAHQAQGRPEQAARCYLAHLAATPGEPNGLHLLGGLLAELGQTAEAERTLRAVLAVQPRRADTLCRLGLLLLDDARPGPALVALNRALAFAPSLAAARSGRDLALHALGRGAEAEGDPAPPPAPVPSHARAAALRALGHAAAALAEIDAALAHNPGNAPAWALRGILQQEAERPQAALCCHERALTIDPRHADAAVNRAAVLTELGRPHEALAAFEAAALLLPEDAFPAWAAATLRLQLGHHAAGWRGYEARPTPLPAGTPWRGEAVAGKRILVRAEQGLGDTLQFCRYAPLLAALGAEVVLQVPAPLVRLLRGLAGVAEVVDMAASPRADLAVRLMSLPHLLGTTATTIPAAVPYLATGAAAWSARLAALPGRKVGLVWAGGPRPDRSDGARFDRRRSLPLAAFAPLGAVPGLTFVSLQKGAAAVQAASPPDGMVLHDWTDALDDFADTAALVQALDLVIAVDTSVAHLAGALGRPVWLLNRYDRCWRWLWDRDDSPWYPTMRLFNQAAPGDWAGVVARVTAALAEVAHEPG